MAFDPYYTWLGIPPAEQPPHAYRLLGIALFEANRAVIENAAERQAAHLQKYQSGAEAAWAKKLLGQIAAAKAGLLNPEKKAAYDAKLQQVLAARQASAAPAAPVAPAPEAGPPQFPQELNELVHTPPSRARRGKVKKSSPVPLAVGLVVVALAAGGGVYYFKFMGGAQESGTAATPALAAAAPADPSTKSKAGDGKAPAVVAARPRPELPSPASYPKKRVVNAADGTVMTLIAGGKFLAGEEQIVVEVPAFFLAAYAITNEQYKKFVDATKHAPPASWPDGKYTEDLALLPVVGVSWNDAQAYCKWAKVRLPTELEWEKGACGTDGRLYPWGDDWSAGMCNSRVKNADSKIRPVNDPHYMDGRSPWGIVQMTGNVWQWCADWYGPTAFEQYKQGRLKAPAQGQERVAKGGSFEDDTPDKLQTHCRLHFRPDTRSMAGGFRVAKDYNPAPVVPAQDVAAKAPAAAQKSAAPEKVPTPDKLAAAKPGTPEMAAPSLDEKVDRPQDYIPGPALAEAVNKVREAYKQDLAKAKRPRDYAELARRVLEQAADASSDPATRFALFEMARELAVKAEDKDLAFDMIDTMGDVLVTGALEIKAQTLIDLGKSSRFAVLHREIVGHALVLLNDAIVQDNLPVARKLGRFTTDEMEKVHDPELVREIRARNSELEQVVEAAAGVDKAKAVLKNRKTKNDPDANRIVAEYLCFVSGNWERGLPLLAEWGDDSLKALAAKDLAGSTSAEGKTLIGNGWWDLAESMTGWKSQELQLHAAHWYMQAIGGLEGGTKTKVGQRLKSVESIINRRLPRRVINSVDASLLVLIPTGAFQAGPTGDTFNVELPAFYLGVQEVTNAQYKKFVDATNHRAPALWKDAEFLKTHANHPVVHVEWEDAQAYCQWAGLRLPTELEWEKGARGSDGRKFPWGNNWDHTKCRSSFNRGEQETAPVRSYRWDRSPYGVFDMSGNVSEWCADWFHIDAYKRYRLGSLNPPDKGEWHVLRGGSFAGPQRLDTYHCGIRLTTKPESESNDIGFRVAKSYVP